MSKDICFMPLGGGQNVGGSSYYMQLGESNILLDAGVNYKNRITEPPDYISLLCSGKIKNINEINQIYISHAHKDHIGYLLETMAQCKYANVYATDMTKKLTRLQLFENSNCSGEDKIIKSNLLDKIVEVSYLEQRKNKEYKVGFMSAGHIPGAMMTMFRYKNRNILYTGDCSISPTALTEGCMLPKCEIDVLILCGLHAKRPSYKKFGGTLCRTIKEVLFRAAYKKRNIKCVVSQLSKGVEFLKMLTEYNHRNIKIYMDSSMVNVVNTLEKANVKVIDENCKTTLPIYETEPHIYITYNKNSIYDYGYDVINVDFTLHDDYKEMKEFIKKINPKKAVIVHTGKDDGTYTIEQDLLNDPNCRTQFIFAENGEMYYL